MKWKCPACTELVDEDFEVCWNCEQPKPESPTFVDEPPEDPVWANNFRRTERPDGTVKVDVFGHTLNCCVSGNSTFRERTTGLETVSFWGTVVATINLACSRCGYIFWFREQ
jgi:hypothetical protein